MAQPAIPGASTPHPRCLPTCTRWPAGEEWCPTRRVLPWLSDPAAGRDHVQAWMSEERKSAAELLSDMAVWKQQGEDDERLISNALAELNLIATKGQLPAFGRPHGAAPGYGVAREQIPATWFDERSQLDAAGHLDQVWPDQHRVVRCFREVHFPADSIRARWPDPDALPKVPVTASVTEPAPPKRGGGRKPRKGWDDFWIEVAIRADLDGLNKADSEERLREHMTEWSAKMPPDKRGDPVHPNTVRDKLNLLFEAKRARSAVRKAPSKG